MFSQYEDKYVEELESDLSNLREKLAKANERVKELEDKINQSYDSFIKGVELGVFHGGDNALNKFAIEKRIEGVNEFVERFNIEYGSGHGDALEEYSEVYCEQLRKEQDNV